MDNQPGKFKTATIILAIIGIIIALILAAMIIPKEYKPERPLKCISCSAQDSRSGIVS